MGDHGLYYTAPFLVGSEKQKLDFDLDTGSSWMNVQQPHAICETCDSTQRFDPSSSTDNYIADKTKIMELQYGSANLWGYSMTDQVCISQDSCVEHFTMLGITK